MALSSLALQNQHLFQWEKNVADTRIHGTTKKHVGKQFIEVEKQALGPLPSGHLCQALGLSAIRCGMTVYYRSIFDTVRDFLHDEAMEGHDRILQRYLKPDLLIIDDMGMKQLPKRSGEYLFEIIMRRHELKSTMMTSNRPLEDWGKLIGDVPSATAILDRFLHRSELFQLTGRSYRLGSSENNSKGAKAPTGSDADTKTVDKASKGAKS